jgi:hypothetical protein
MKKRSFRVRFKSALFNFFKEEILKELGHNPIIPLRSERYVINQTSFEVLEITHVIEIPEGTPRRGTYDHYSFEEKVYEMKRKFADACIPHIHVETQELLMAQPGRFMGVRFSLKIQSKQN